jgi:hypothetical protein
VGEASVWRITLLSGTRSQELVLRPIDPAQQTWEIAPRR